MNNYFRFGILSINEMLHRFKAVSDNMAENNHDIRTNKKELKRLYTQTFIVGGLPIKIKMWSLRYQLFCTKGITCVGCGISGSYFAVERFQDGCEDKGHFNLYSLTNGFEILMTKDHIIPKAKGGKDHIDNLQTMCTTCNLLKGNKSCY